MLKVVWNKIYLTKGDTARFDIKVSDEIPNNSTMYFIVTDTPAISCIEDVLDHTGNCVFYKEGPSILINSTDTACLKKSHYYYHVRIVSNDTGEVTTIIEPEDFILTPVN